MRMTRLIIRDYCGIQAADLEIPPGGIVIRGGGGKGKTSILRGIRAALLARGVDAASIRNGADKAELLVDFDALHVRRSIRPRKHEVTVADATGQVQPSPQTLLDELFGRDIDPLEFYKADDKKRRKLIYEAMPMRVTVDDVYRWTGEKLTAISEDHGLEVLERIRKKHYDRRTDANAAAEESERAAQLAFDAADQLECQASAVSVEEARQLLEDVNRENGELLGRQKAHQAARDGAGPTLTKIEELRYQAGQAKTLPLSYEYQISSTGVLSLGSEVVMEKHIAIDEARVAAMKADLASIREGQRLLREMQALEASLAGIDAMAVPQAEIDALTARSAAAQQALVGAEKAARYATARATAELARAQAAKDKERAKELDRVVKVLTNDAPGELAKREKGIPGLVLGDRIELDGVPLDINSGTEQMFFAIRLAKRARSDGRLLICDGLERLDEDDFPVFVKEAVSGGWQMIGTRVTKGPLEIIAITGDEE